MNLPINARLTVWTVFVTWSVCSPSIDAHAIDFKRDILPILESHCVDCHGADTAEGELRLDSLVGALRGGDSGEPAIVPGESGRSYLIARVTDASPQHRMPPDSDPLDEETIEKLRQWVDDPSQWDAARRQIKQPGIDHWSFQPLSRPAVPETLAHPIDGFVSAKLSEADLTFSAEASRRTLIRRLYLVMHGLPPAPDEVTAFLNDDRPEAWSELVERVLASTHYGERWATHWLDLVRFGETHGFETNRERPNAWRYRDWVIEAFNSDLPYDQFVMQQIAGDRLGKDIATGFLVAGPHDIVKGQDPLLRLVQRQDELADIINATGTAFLGLTTGCARCHNHKFDPISQTDYYALQAVFAGVQHGERSLQIDESTKQRIEELDRIIADLRRQLKPYVSSNAKRPPVDAKSNIEVFDPTTVKFVRMTIQATNQGEPCIDELEIYGQDINFALASNGGIASSSGDFVHPLHKLEHINDGRLGNPRSWIANKTSGGWIQIELANAATIDRIVWGRDREGRYADRLATNYKIEASVDGENWQRLADSTDRLPPGSDDKHGVSYDFAAVSDSEADLGRKQLRELETAIARRDELSKPPMAYAGSFQQPPPTHRLYRGEPTSPREQVFPAAITSLSTLTNNSLNLDADTPEAERRVALARWIADRGNPLTARVIVNRIWQHHFGTGIVDTPSDFGGNGTPPSHPALLDWLACELIDNNWSLKHLHRVILNSQTWRQQSYPNDKGMAVDAGSRLLWRFPPRRLEAEGIRDCILSVTGSLDTRQGGPGFSAFEVEAENVRHYFPKTEFGPEDWRRMIYMTKVRQERDAVFGVFDCPDCSQVVPQRSRSTTPLQALNLFNSRFVIQQSELLVQRLDESTDSPEQKVRLAYELCFGRPATDEEVNASLAFVQSQSWNQFARALLNANEFIFIP
ncbi:MAG: DUF1553 domain-containing protein [Pirellulaceae bacterium]